MAVNGATTIAGGKLGRGGDFIAASGHYLNLGSSVGDYTDNFSISLWFKTSTVDWGRLITRRVDDTVQYDLAITSAGQIRFYVGGIYTGNSLGLADGAWHHLALVIDGASSMIYVDGQPDRAVFNPIITSRAVNTLIASSFFEGAPSSLFNGQLDDVAIWQRALFEAEVQSLYNNGLARVIPVEDSFFLPHELADIRPDLEVVEV